ncbi:hypothetical protein BT67DRAFT_75077 [Trichocladium antarcticum]|uniref:Uncharacterized protein n=1 Tax=Trichocladium antarcticum TaxID=1450529 RepID=A0AAN6ZCR6_9PEZI|nr:hypothetical protein BT67DRAFT_75077 [Trichocladium antarcticum]
MPRPQSTPEPLSGFIQYSLQWSHLPQWVQQVGGQNIAKGAGQRVAVVEVEYIDRHSGSLLWQVLHSGRILRTKSCRSLGV